VVVALPEMFHKEAILAALGRGMHVLTEKPLVMTTTEAREVVRAARGAEGSTLMVDQNYRWRPQTQTLRKALRGRAGRDDRLDRLRVPAGHHADDHGWVAGEDGASLPP